MGADDLLSALLRSLQTPDPHHDPQSYLGAALSTLVSLNNPLNVTLLTNQLLLAPALWSSRHDSTLHFAFLSLFHSAVADITRRFASKGLPNNATGPDAPGLRLETWTNAVLRGVDARSHPARHVPVLAGVLIGLGDKASHSLTTRCLQELYTALIRATNAAAQDPSLDQQAQTGFVLALAHCFQWLPPAHLARLDSDHLLPILMHALLHSSDGLDSLSVLRRIDQDVHQIGPTRFAWDGRSSSFAQIEAISVSPLYRGLGPLAKLVALTLEHVRDSSLVLASVEDLRDFATTLHSLWHANKLSEVDSAEQTHFLAENTLNQTLPVLWTVLRSTLFAAVIVLGGALSRSLNDRTLATSFVSPRLAQHTLTTLRHLNFILSRLGATTLSQFTFVHMTAIDILAAYPEQGDEFVQCIAPVHLGRMPSHPLDREDDLFFFNTVEHMTLFLPPSTSESIILRATDPYITANGHTGLTRLFEAAHSVTLAVFSAPQNSRATINRIPGYISILQESVFSTISTRQFRLAFKTMVRIASSDGPINASDPDLSSLLVQILYNHALHADDSIVDMSVPLSGSTVSTDPPAGNHTGPSGSGSESGPSSRRALYIHSMTDCIPFLPLADMEEWLGLLGRLVQSTHDHVRLECARHVWNTLFDGGIEPERGVVCAVWWTTLGGREMCFGGSAGSAGSVRGGRGGRDGHGDQRGEFIHQSQGADLGREEMHGALQPSGTARL